MVDARRIVRILILDTRKAGRTSDLFVVNAENGAWKRVRLGYVPEIHFNRAANELAIVETELGGKPWRKKDRYWLKLYTADTLKLIRVCETPIRPMYTGYPGRSAYVDSSPSGRYLFVLETGGVLKDPVADSVFRLTASRYDRELNRFEKGQFAVDSCAVAFAHMGPSDHDLYFHLSCDFPSTIAFGSFDSPAVDLLPMEPLERRVHDARESCGSWLDRETETLYCVSGDGIVYEIGRQPPTCGQLIRLPLEDSQSIPLKQIYGGGGSLFVGVSANPSERGVSVASQVWQVSIADRKLVKVIDLPFPAMNFVTTEDGRTLVGTNPFRRVVFVVDTAAGSFLQQINIGMSPAEVQLLP
jgi:hypothetical protein